MQTVYRKQTLQKFKALPVDALFSQPYLPPPPPPPPCVFLMDPTISLLLLLLTSFFTNFFGLTAATPTSVTRITVVGAVYCDTCLSNSVFQHSYFLPGVDVHLQCKFRAVAPKMAEQMTVSVNRTTDKNGVYRLEIPSVDGINCVDGMTMQSFCEASLIGSSTQVCNVPGLRTTSEEISVKSKQDNLCIFSLNALSYRPLKKNASLCGNKKEKMPDPLTSSKFFLPFFPPYSFPFPFPPLPPFPSFPLPPFRPLPPLPPVPYFPLPTCPNPPSLPFPFPPLPPLFPSPPSRPPPSAPPPPPPFSLSDPRTWIPYVSPFSPPPPPPSPPPPFSLSDPRTWIPHVPPFSPPPPPAFDPQDPRTWIPHIPLFSPPPPPAFDPRDPRTWIPHIPPFFRPPPPAFDLRDPRTWIPHLPPSPPHGPEDQNP